MTFEYIRLVLTRCDQNMGRVLEYDQNIVTRGTVVVFSLDSSSNQVLWATCTVGNTKLSEQK